MKKNLNAISIKTSSKISYDTVDAPEVVIRKTFPETWIFDTIEVNEGYIRFGQKQFLQLVNVPN